MTTTPRILLIASDPTLSHVVVSAFSGVLEVVAVSALDDAFVELRARGFDALAWDAEEFGDRATGFRALVNHIAPGLRVISTRQHLVPHLVTASRIRPSSLREWAVRPTTGSALVDAMVASADDPVFGGPHIN